MIDLLTWLWLGALLRVCVYTSHLQLTLNCILPVEDVANTLKTGKGRASS